MDTKRVLRNKELLRFVDIVTFVSYVTHRRFKRISGLRTHTTRRCEARGFLSTRWEQTRSVRPGVRRADDDQRGARSQDNCLGLLREPGSRWYCQVRPPFASPSRTASRPARCRSDQYRGCRSVPSADATTRRNEGSSCWAPTM